MASFTIFANIGLSPNPGQNVYFIISPFFEAVGITNQLTNNDGDHSKPQLRQRVQKYLHS